MTRMASSYRRRVEPENHWERAAGPFSRLKPQVTGTAAQFEDAAFLREIEVVEHPPVPAVFVHAETFVKLKPGI